ARVGRPHGVRGEVSVEVRTDAPGRRFVPGASFLTDPADVGPLVLEQARAQGAGTVLRFAVVDDRDAAEQLRGTLLLVVDDPGAEPDDDDAWPVSALVGLRAELADGTLAGTVTGLEHSPAHDLLLVEQPSGAVALVPFVSAIVPVVDVPGGRVVLDPPGGLVEARPPVEPDPGPAAP
ncbi:MAG: 16S rRNA processing protein RimM, partial [uncultured Quadrisphaera sp.]